jgi:L-idonate 5-dehydrogenase
MTSALAATLFGAQDLQMVEHVLPPLAKGWVRVRLSAGGICGSDLHYFQHGRNGDFVVRAPLILGHELAGTVLDINGEIAGLTPGDRIAINPSRWCGVCPPCCEGRPNLCENIYFMGSASKFPHMQGGFAATFDVALSQCVKLPADVSLEAAALAEPLAVCLHAVERAGDLAGKSIAIIGAGPIGLLTLLAARLAGAAETTAVDIASRPLAFAQRFGADHIVDTSRGGEALTYLAGARPFDVTFEASGSPTGLTAALTAVRRGGTVVQVGDLPTGDIPFPGNLIVAKELDLRGTQCFGPEFNTAVRLIAEGKVDVLPLITARRPLAEAPAAMRLALDRNQSMKVVLTVAEG